jgi:transmembrane sensor
MSREIFRQLLNKYISGELKFEEKARLNEMLSQSGYGEEMDEFVREIMLSEDYSGIASPQVRDRIHAYLDQHIQMAPINTGFKWRRLAAAASIIIIASAAFYFFVFHKLSNQIAKTEGNPIKNDLAPGSNKAILTLGNGSTIILDSAHIGTLGLQGNAKVIKSDSGRLAYSISSSPLSPGKGAGAVGEIVYNTLSTPRGGQYQLELQDGTMVWLNAASSIRYPTVFVGRERRVEITGEVYLEVTKDSKMAFIVNVNNDAEVEVLGTHFNVMAYTDEPAVKTTLLEGAVKFSKGTVNRILKPGEQAELNRSGEMKVVNNANLEDVIAWKNGFFQFHRASTQAVMRQIARWYDVQISYVGNIPEEQLGGRISRNNNASEVLRILEISNVHFRIEGKKIIVTP